MFSQQQLLNLKEYIRILKTTKRKQCKGALKKNKEYCALGICAVSFFKGQYRINEHGIFFEVSIPSNLEVPYDRIETLHSVIPYNLMTEKFGGLPASMIIDWNDNQDYTFKKIARSLEEIYHKQLHRLKTDSEVEV